MAFTAESDFLREPPKVQETWLECFFASHVPTQLREYSDSSSWYMHTTQPVCTQLVHPFLGKMSLENTYGGSSHQENEY